MEERTHVVLKFSINCEDNQDAALDAVNHSDEMIANEVIVIKVSKGYQSIIAIDY